MTDVRETRFSFPGASFDESEAFASLRFEDEGKSSESSKCGDDPGQFRQILTDEESRTLLTEHKKYLKLLVAKGHKDLQSIGFHRMNQSSLRSSVTERLDRSMMSLQKLEADITDATEDLTDFSEHRFDGHLVFDFDEQQRALDISRNSHSQRHNDDDNDDDDSFALPVESSGAPQPVPAASRTIPLSPDLSVPLRGSIETWQAIRHGCTVAVTCSDCNTELHAIEDAEYIVCPDCWMVGPVEETIGGIALEFDGCSDNYGLALGVKVQDVVQWVEEEASKTQVV
jgi:hypothetical protein